MSGQLDQIRREISELDFEILQALERRVRLAEKAGEIKRDEGIPIRDQEREAEVLEQARELSKRLDGRDVREAWESIFKICLRAQQ
jgi:chorismate mutase/prephenate dehydratase